MKSTIKADAAATEFLQGLRAVAASQGITATEAVREAIAVTGASRVGIKHAAILVGINARTARNTYDRFARA